VIPLFAADKKTRLPIVFNGLTLNDPTDDLDDILEINKIRPQRMYDSILEARSQRPGLEVYSSYKRGMYLRILGMIRAPSKGRLYDRIEQLTAAFDPDILAHDNPDEAGFLPLDFNIPTADLTNFPSGVIPCRYYVRPVEGISDELSQYEGRAVPFMVSLLAADPHRYLQNVSQLTGAGSADNLIATTSSWPILTIAMTGSGSASFSITSTEAQATLALDLSGLANLDSVVVDMEKKTIEVNAADESSRFVSGDFFHIEPGTNTITLANATSASPTLTWRPAFSN
jgi:hypothetical protein